MLVFDMQFTTWGLKTAKVNLVDFGSDGASVCMAAGGLQEYLEADITWVFWCLAHRLELSLKDSLNPLLMHLY